ncbi:AGC/YANK protein kinase [Podila verticillata NRRL 6337]|nr:AGC/YANK protein kinase [Podila verticillata NRRL 6337]
MGAGCCKEEAIDFTAEIELSHFHLLRSVGKGAFGKVRVVQHKKTKEIYALKYINKAKCIRMRAVENIIQERRLLEEVEFPLICNLRYAFQDDENLFMVLDLMLGGDLRFHLERAGPMREDVVRFYVAELALALDALHSRRIIHRDLKPDNVLLDENGHAHLTDFNIAVYYHPSKPLVSIAGSMAYMAPEVLLRKGYFESVDWWSLGVVTFELLFGKRPFRGKSNDMLTNSILRDPLPFPDNVSDLVSANCVDVLSKLCERDISKRLGCTSEGLDGFKRHPWFEGFDWDKLVSKEAIPPFEPDSKRANFDATHELEELLMEDNPLKAKKRAQINPEIELSAEMQLMEDKFTVYDFTKVKRSQSLTRGKILRSGQDQKTTSGTLDGVVTRTNTGTTTLVSGTGTNRGHGREQSLGQDAISMNTLMAPPPRIYRPDSPSDRIGQDRFNPDEDQVALINQNSNISRKNSPLNPANTSQDTYNNNFSDHMRAEAEKTAYQQQHQQYLQNSYQTQQLDTSSLLQSEAIILPPSSLPRPLQPRDHLTGIRNGSPYGHQTSSGHSNHNHSNITTPSTPSNSSYGQSTTLTSVSTPPTIYTASPAVFTGKVGGQGTVLFSDNGHNNLPLSPPLMDSANIPTTTASPTATPTRRAVRGRESLSSQSINSMPAANLNTNVSSIYQQQQLDGTLRRPPSPQMRPMSAYTTSRTQVDGDLSSREPRAYQDKSYHHGQQPSYSSGFYRASLSGMDEGNLANANTGRAYHTHNIVHPTTNK